MSEPAYVCMECARTTSGRCVQHSYVSIPKQDILSGCIALRKRVEELEAHEQQTHEQLGTILGTDDALHVLAARLKARAEKAERERDEFARKAVGMELVWSGTNAELEDALDYALWLRSVTGLEPANLDAEREDPEPYPGEQVEDRVLALLAARKEAKR